MKVIQLLEAINIEKTVEKLGDRLKAKMDNDPSVPENMDVKDLVRHVVDNIDQSTGDKYTLWILRTYYKDGIRFFEDMERTRDALIMFDANKNRLELERRDINRYKSLSELEGAVSKFVEEDEADQEEYERAIEESEILYEGPEGMLIVPETYDAARYWGRGTSWCTSKSKSPFNDYTERGPLYIILDSDGKHKYQLHMPSKQYMDRHDNRMSVDDIRKYKQMISEIREHEGGEIPPDLAIMAGQDIPENEMVNAVYMTPELIRYIKNPPEDVQMAALKGSETRKINILRLIDNPSRKVIEKAIEINPKNIHHVSNPPEDILVKALEGYPKYILEIDNPTDEMKMAAIRGSMGLAIRYIEDPTDEMKEYAVSINGRMLKYIDDPTEKMIRLAVINEPTLISKVDSPPEDLQIMAVRNLPSSIAMIRQPSPKAIKAALEINGDMIINITNPPEWAKKIAVRTTPESIRYIRNPSKEVQMIAVGTDPRSIAYIDSPSFEVQMEAVKNNPSAFRLIRNKDPKIIEYMVKNHPDKVDDLDMLPMNMLIDVFSKFPSRIQKVKELSKEEEHDILMKVPEALPYARYRHTDPELYALAAKEAPHVFMLINDIPDELKEVAIKARPDIINLLRNPSEELVSLASNLGATIDR